MLRTAPGLDMADLAEAPDVAERAGAAVGGASGVEQAVKNMTTADAMRMKRGSMQGTINLLGEFMGHTFDCREVFDACARHTANATESLQQLGTLFRTDARNFFKPA